MNKSYFAIALHFNQPVGNFSEILERSYENCYRPFLELFSKYPDIKMSFHFSGSLLDYLEANHPEFLDELMKLVIRGQVEVMGGGYYEPIFQAIPKRDRIGQIEMLSSYSEKRFATKPKGIWIPERVWSSEIIPDLTGCGMKYCILDSAHLVKAGVNQDDLYGYFIAKDKDKKIAVFPSDETLRYMIPFRFPNETIDYFASIAEKKDHPLFIYGDDAEKFGEWPWTYDWVYKKGWLNSFFKTLVESRDWLETVKFSEYMDTHLSLKEVEIPEASYMEMMQWSEGSWTNFFKKYPESNHMHKRMLYISEKINRLADNSRFDAGQDKQMTLKLSSEKTLESKKLEEARKELYKAQCNCPYWHGVFGGIYLYHLRSSVYEHLINADRIIDTLEYTREDDWIGFKKIDFYNEKKNLVTYENKDFFICIDPSQGGVIRELDYKKNSINLINTLTRRRESYHKKILDRINDKPPELGQLPEPVKDMDPRIKKGIFYDKDERACLIDHFIDKDLKREDFETCNYTDLGDFHEAGYRAKIEDEKLILSRDGKLEEKPFSITKQIHISSEKEINVSYTLKNKSESKVDSLFGIEFNITMPFANSDRYSYKASNGTLAGLDEGGSAIETKVFAIKDSQDDLGLEFIFSEEPNNIWYFPVGTISQSEKSYDLNYQSSCIFPIWNIKLASKEEIKIDIRWRMV